MKEKLRRVLVYPFLKPFGVSVLLIISSYLVVTGIVRFITVQTSQTAVGIVGSPRIIHPLYQSLSSIDTALAPLFYRSLLTFNQESQPIPDLAESWEISEDGLVYTIYLKTDQLWEDDQPITASDVVFTINQINDLTYTGPEKNRFVGVGVALVNDYTLTLTLTEQFSPFLESLNIGILPQHIWEDLSIEDISTSLYSIEPVSATNLSVVEVSTDTDHISRMEIENRMTHKRFELLFFISEDDLAQAIKLGTVDVGIFAVEEIAKQFADWNNLSISAKQVCGTSITWFSNQERDTNHPVKNSTFNESVASLFTQDEQLPSLRFTLPTNHWAYREYTINTKLTAEQMRAAFAIIPADSPLKVSVMPDIAALLSVQAIRDAFETSGLNASITLISQENVQQMLFDREYDVLLARQDFGHDPDQYIFWHSTQTDIGKGGLNISEYKNRRMDKALEDGRLTSDQTERKDAYGIMQQRLSEDMPALFFTYPNVFVVSRIKAQTTSIDSCLWLPTDWLSKSIPH